MLYQVSTVTRRGLAVVLSMLVIAGGLVATATHSLGQVGGAPKIALLNPSSFSTAGERGIIVSDALPDDGPNCCQAADGAYRLSAWTANAPPGSNVFFSVSQRAIELEINATSQTNANTWVADWDIPETFLDGPATVRAYLVLNEQAVAVAEQAVTIMKIQENVDLTYPVAGGSFGTFAPLAGALPEAAAAQRKKPVGVVDALYTLTPEISYVRTFYSTSAPGSAPQWKVCGTETIGTAAPANGVRCTLSDPIEQTQITAVAAVANDSPDEYDNRFNQSGDAISVGSAYAQQLTKFVRVNETFERVQREPSSGRFYCSTAEVVQLTDQFERQIAGANIDVHATGPSDSLKFDTFAILTKNQVPDRNNHATEAGFDCTGQRTAEPTSPPGNANPDEQGEHPRFGAADRKHVESLGGGTSDTGTWSFRMNSDQAGITEFTVWVDEADDGCVVNDDAFTSGELNVSGGIGWAEDVISVTPHPTENAVPCSPVDPSPEPSPTPTPTEEPPSGDRSVSLGATRRSGRVKLSGTIESERAACARNQRVVIRVRGKNGKFSKLRAVISNGSGRFSTSVSSKPKRYRAVTPKSGVCGRAVSNTVRVRRA